MTRLSFSLLGTLQISLDDAPVTTFEYNKVKALLAYLAAEGDRPHSRESLAGLLWPDLPDTVARKNLSQALANIRQSIGDRGVSQPFLLVTRETVQFNLASDHWIDTAAFRALLDACEAHLHRHVDSCASCAQRLGQAARLYQGDFLAHFFLADSSPFEEWTQVKREALRQRALRALAYLTAFHQRHGDFEPAAVFARRQLELDPWREPAHRQLMHLLVLNGQRNAALKHYDAFRRELNKDLDAQPEMETTALYDLVRSGEPVVVTPAGFQARTQNFPPRSNPFIGRHHELRQIADLIEQPACRLLTLTGPGGIGKTRLAIRAAQDQATTFADGVYYVSLVPLNSAEYVVSAIASAMAFTFHSPNDPKDQLVRFLREKELLLVLDGADDLLAEQPSAEIVVGLVRDILSEAPGVSMLVTSRERLRLKQEWLFEVPGLAVPPHETTSRAEDYDAVQLYVQCARRADHKFELTADKPGSVIRICRLLAGLPLGIEMAAGWVRVISGTAIAEEVHRDLDFLQAATRDVPERHKSLRAVFDHSWQLLTKDEQRVFEQLSVFRGGFEREAAEQVAGATLNSLSALADKSLLQSNTRDRYDIHALLRQYGQARLLESSEADSVQRRHATHYLALAEAGASATLAINLIQPRWLDQMETELDNIRAALTWSRLAAGSAELGLRLAYAMTAFYYYRGYWSEARAWLEGALAHPLAVGFARVRAQALQALGHLLTLQGDYESGQAQLTNSLLLCQELEDFQLSARVLFALGLLAREHGDGPTAHLRLEESIAQYRKLGDLVGVGWSLVALGEVAVMEADAARAMAILDECLGLFSKHGVELGIAWAQNHLGHLAQLQGDYGRAEQLHVQSQQIFLKFGEKLGIAWALQSLGEIALARGERAGATRHFTEAMGLFRSIGDRAGLAWCLAGLAGAAVQEEPSHAARLWGVAKMLRQTLGAREPPAAGATQKRLVAEARRQLGNAAFAAAWAEGEAASPEQAIDQSLRPYAAAN